MACGHGGIDGHVTSRQWPTLESAARSSDTITSNTMLTLEVSVAF